MIILTVSSISFSESSDNVVFIVNIDNPLTEISAADISDYYFKRKRQWSNNESVRFLDRTTSNRSHEIFLKSILKKSKLEVELYWIGQKLYEGDSAPLRETSDNATIQFVSSFKGAIAYVSADTVIESDKVKIIKLAGSKED